MEDVIRYHVIRLTPVEFLDVATWTRAVAIGAIGEARVMCDHVAYWRVIRLLGARDMAHAVAQFTANNYLSHLFTDLLRQLKAAGRITDRYQPFKYFSMMGDMVKISMINIVKVNFEMEEVVHIRDDIGTIANNELLNWFLTSKRYGTSPKMHGLVWRIRNNLTALEDMT
ncbi:hypothetical protein F-LCD7_0016 [Faustovirus]|nr:hypothetical protein F-LCD7_0016 [Faustovirus]